MDVKVKVKFLVTTVFSFFCSCVRGQMLKLVFGCAEVFVNCKKYMCGIARHTWCKVV